MLSRYHIEITKKSLENFFSPFSLREIARANVAQDSLPSMFGVEARRHVCNCTVLESLAYIDEEQAQLASIVRGPLAQGILTGKFTPESVLPADDVRHSWDFREGEQAKRLKALGAIREVLTANKRTLAQGALGWLWARSGVMIPIPGFKHTEQVEENAAAMWFGPLDEDQMAELKELMAEAYERQR